MFNRIYALLESCASDSPLFPPTILYNEGWLLRLVLDWFQNHRTGEHPLSFTIDSSWFSEALLPSAFQARYRGDTLAESSTHLDGVIGHFIIGSTGKTDFSLLSNALQLVACEAKMFSSLSSGIKNARYFDQAARNVACIAEVLRRANRHPSEVPTLGFCVLAPESQIERGIFAKEIKRESIHSKVQQRVGEYGGVKDQWYKEWFQPTLHNIEIRTLSWEETIEDIRDHDADSGDAIERFYQHCVKFNG